MNKKIRAMALMSVFAICLAGCGNSVQTPTAASSTSEVAVEETKVYFKSDKGLNRLFTNYAAIAEYPFVPEDIKQGNIRTKALIYTEDLSIELVNSQNGLTIRVDSDKAESESLYPVVRDFLKILDGSLSDEQILQAWSDIKEIGTKFYSEGAYSLNKLQLTYSDTELYGSRQVKVDIYAPEYQG